MTSYQDFAQIVAAALRAAPDVAGAITTGRNEIVVELTGGETFQLEPMFLTPTELTRRNIAEQPS